MLKQLQFIFTSKSRRQHGVPGILSKRACVLVTILISHIHTNKKWRRATTHGASAWQLCLSFLQKKVEFHKHPRFMAASYANLSAPFPAHFNRRGILPKWIWIIPLLEAFLEKYNQHAARLPQFSSMTDFVNSSNSRGGRQQHFVWNQALRCLLILHAPTVVARV